MTLVELPINLPMPAITTFCEEYGIIRLSLFGSVLREDFQAHSDVDVLVEFAKNRVPSLLRLIQMQDELSQMIGREVDDRTSF